MMVLKMCRHEDGAVRKLMETLRNKKINTSDGKYQCIICIGCAEISILYLISNALLN